MHRLQQWCIRAANAITDLFDRRVVPEEQLQTTTTPPIDHRQKNTRTDNAKGVDSNGFTPNDNNNVDIESNVWKPIARPASGSNDLRRDIFYTALEQQTPISNIQSMPMIPPTLPLVPSSFQLSPVVSQSFPTSSITTRRLQWTQPPPPAQQTNYYSQYDTLEGNKPIVNITTKTALSTPILSLSLCLKNTLHLMFCYKNIRISSNIVILVALVISIG
ncbi:hypothetical protein BDA99DRAFT_496028 [Phascolomyces articulosus]|uniref:Uncharacterized protein n=1 Tax=Phascolomyces articulosus TaxID=60185 RepID=A0AAD5K9Y0_9FUNG|nr:hypothetical protein BDA99DRAFT_496028 [Phascolomyces articulosus]